MSEELSTSRLEAKIKIPNMKIDPNQNSAYLACSNLANHLDIFYVAPEAGYFAFYIISWDSIYGVLDSNALDRGFLSVLSNES